MKLRDEGGKKILELGVSFPKEGQDEDFDGDITVALQHIGNGEFFFIKEEERILVFSNESTEECDFVFLTRFSPELNKDRIYFVSYDF